MTIELEDPRLAAYGLGALQDWTSPTLVKVYDLDREFTDDELWNWDESRQELTGYVFVKRIKEKDGQRSLFKLAAGHKKREADEVGWNFDHSPLDTAHHETESETGMIINPRSFRFVDKYMHWSKTHWKCVHIARVTRANIKTKNDHHPENEGVSPKFFTIDEFYTGVCKKLFLSEHVEKLFEFGIIPVP